MTGKRFKKIMMGKMYKLGRNEADYYLRKFILIQREREKKKMKCCESIYENCGFILKERNYNV